MAKNPSASHTSKSTADDRNLVEVTPNLETITLEDRLYLLWKNHSQKIVLLVIAIIAAVCVWFWAQWNKHNVELAIEADYQNAITAEQQDDFTHRYPKHTLSGVIWKSRGDQAFIAGNYQQAAEYFGKAVDVLPGLAGWQARMGYGVSLLQAGDGANGLRVLQTIAHDPNANSVLRAEAYWQMAIHAWSEGNILLVEENFHHLQEIDTEGVFFQEIQMVRSLLPQHPK